MGYPDFVCMGFQKCATTTLYDLLKQHPQIVLCRDVKEPMYYRVPLFSFFGQGKRFYKWRYFGHVEEGDKRLKGEVNAGLTFTNCAKKVSRNMPPDTKMIFMMRNPVDRSYSSYKYFLARGFLTRDAVKYDIEHGHAAGFDHYVHDVLDNPKKRSKVMDKRFKYLVFSQSNYAACIREFLSTYDVKNMNFVIFEDFVRHEHEQCREIYSFLGIEDAPDIQYDLQSNESAEKPVSPVKSKCFMFLKGCNHFLYDLCCITHWSPWLYDKFRLGYNKARSKCLAEDTDRSKVLPETRAYLKKYYDADVRDLEQLTARDLRTIWNW